MASGKDSDKDRELRRLRRENKVEHEESKRRMAELRAAEARKEQLYKLVQLKEDELRRTQADLVSRYRELERTEINRSDITQHSALNTEQETNKEETSFEQRYGDQSADESFETVDT